ncbi:hypothetical protein N431DRAFT_434975 [Stipitochalara longipes BDJ]|nr:hypothetical protein N431DRAFT_434975 [Stipitochalara longipes BDJ]
MRRCSPDQIQVQLHLAAQLYCLLQPSRPGHTTNKRGLYHSPALNSPVRLLLILPCSEPGPAHFDRFFKYSFPAMPGNYISDLPVSMPLKFNDINTISIPSHTTLSLSMSMGGSNGGTRTQPSPAITTVAQALEIARDSPEGARDPTVVNILETALTDIWRKIEAHPTSYVMTRDEFAVFNYFQDRFAGQELAAAARKRYWDRLELRNGN